MSMNSREKPDIPCIQESRFYHQGNDLKNNNSIEVDFKCPIMDKTYLIVSNNTEDEQRNIKELSTKISNNNDVEKLLEHVNWRMFIYLCDQDCNNFTYSKYELEKVSSNSSCCFSDSIDDLFSSIIQCGNTNCNKAANSFGSKTWFIVLILGIICLLGNAVVIYDKMNNLRKVSKKNKEVQIYHVLILNLAYADLLMGIYLTAITFELRQKAIINVAISETAICNALGILNTTSSQVSISIIFIISLYRLISLIRPYKQHHFKIVVTVTILTWIFWLVVASLPLVPLQTFKAAFNLGLIKNRQVKRDSFLDFSQIFSIIEKEILPSFNNVTEVESILQAVAQFQTPSVMEKFSTAVGWVRDTANWSLVGHNDSQYACSMDFFILHEEYRGSVYYSLTLVCFNLALSVAIFLSYLIVTLKVYEKEGFCFVWCKCFISCYLWRNFDIFAQAKSARSAENRKIIRRISFILLTDLLCWIPLCLISLVIWCISTTKENVNNLRKDVIPFSVTFIILSIINSILNPYIYSYRRLKSLFKKIKRIFSST